VPQALRRQCLRRDKGRTNGTPVRCSSHAWFEKRQGGVTPRVLDTNEGTPTDSLSRLAHIRGSMTGEKREVIEGKTSSRVLGARVSSTLAAR